jgi:MFS family permease
MLILPPLLPLLMSQFDLSLAWVTYMATISSFLFGVMALPGGFLADKWSYKAVLALFFIGTATAACIVGSARSVLSLGIGLSLVGLFGSLYHPSGLAMISHGVRQRGKALGLHGMAGNLGIALSPIIAGGLALRLSWRYAYYILSVPGFIAGAVLLLKSRLIPKDGKSSAAQSATSTESESKPPGHTFTIWAIILLYAAAGLTGFCYRGVVTMLPTYLGKFNVGEELQSDLDRGMISENIRQEFVSHRTELSENSVVSVEDPGRKWIISDKGRRKNYTVMKERGRLNVYGPGTFGRLVFATMVYLVGMMGQYMGGHFSDRRRRTRLYLLFSGLSLPFMFLIGLTPGMMVVPVAALFALFHFANQPVENSLIAQFTPSHLRSSGYGLKFILTFGFGSFASGFSGYVAENYGFNSVFLALGGVILLIVIVTTLLNVVAREKRVEASQ